MIALGLSLLLQLSPSLEQDLLRRLTYSAPLRHGKTVYVRHCRLAPEGGCPVRIREFAIAFIVAGHHYGLDPYLLAAIALRESGMNPWAVGPKGSIGVMQVHPYRKAVRRTQFFTDRRYCATLADACQEELIMIAAGILARSIKICGGNERCGLCLYQTGETADDCDYAWSVRGHYVDLRGASETAA